MERLDNQYLATLVKKAQKGGSNAFAELYTATYQSVFEYSYGLLSDEDKCKEALKATYVRALKEINKLSDPELVVSWLYHLSFEICSGMKVIDMLEKSDDVTIDTFKIDGKTYRVGQLSKNLPMTEAQILVMHYYQNYSFREIRKLLGLDKFTEKYLISSGKQHLKQLLGEA